MRSLIVNYIVSFTILFLSGGNHLLGQKDSAAEPFLDKIAKDFDAEEAFFINFSYEREDQQTGSITEGNGSLLMYKDKYRIDFGNAIIFFDGKKQYSLQMEIKEVYISVPNPENKEFMFSDPIKLLRNYKEKFKYRLVGVSSLNNIEMTEIQLFPEELGGPYALLKLYFDIQTDTLEVIVIRHKDGVLYSMSINEMIRKDHPGNEYFQFNQEDFPDVDIIELIN